MTVNIGLTVHVCVHPATGRSSCGTDSGRTRAECAEQRRQSVPAAGERQRRQRHRLAGNCSHVPAHAVRRADGRNGHGCCQADQGDDAQLLRGPFRQLDCRSGRLGMLTLCGLRM